jgi:hypothetical protein
MEEDYPLDDAEFYDGPDEHDGRPGQAYRELKLPNWLLGESASGIAMPDSLPPPVPRWMHVPEAAPPPPARLLTPEEFRAKMAEQGIILPDPPGEPGRAR